MEVLVEHDRLKNWEKLKGGEVLVDENKENQPIISRVMTKRTHITDIICYESSSKNEKQTGERSSNKVKYTKGEMNLQLEPDYFVKQEKGSSILSEQPVWKRIEIECSPREFIKQLLTTAARAEWTFNQELYDEIHQKQVWIKQEEEILKSTTNELSQKDKIALGLDKLREDFIPRDIKKEIWKERCLRVNEWKKNIGITQEQKRKGTKKRKEKRREPEGEKSINLEARTGEKETVPNDKKPKRHWTEVLSIAKEEVYEWIGQEVAQLFLQEKCNNKCSLLYMLKILDIA
ncbi:13410_t:CDS:2 [Gigaspora margarita]|uniref:13410_t:CDS:1 n=1 Tax=Gigaspora margarita TaxID=4874 RepID=A0ABN7UDP0_GIGMA|nr:13410_t:CDS:2 [Gigaspora margarita]